jgi:hypothetical protein
MWRALCVEGRTQRPHNDALIKIKSIYMTEVYLNKIIAYLLMFWIVIITINKKRHPKQWNVIKIFFTVLIITLGTNYAKDNIKKWWDK